MNIGDKDLRLIYAAHLEPQNRSLRVNCPSQKDILLSIDENLTDKSKKKIIEHVSCCPACAKDLKWLLELRRETVKLSEEAGALAKRRNLKTFGFGIPLGHAAASFLGLIALSISLWTLIGGGGLLFISQERQRTGPTTAWHLLEPVGKTAFKINLSFRWEYSGQYSYFIVELYNEALAPIWKSPQLSLKSIFLPEDVLRTLSLFKQYFWMVSAYDPGGFRSESDLIQFEFNRHQ